MPACAPVCAYQSGHAHGPAAREFFTPRPPTLVCAASLLARQMDLKPCPEEYGGRCANGAACKAKGGADAPSHQWTFVDKKEKGKYCRDCVRKAAP
jgi:hypothetical protein